MSDPIKSTISEIKSEFKISKIIAFAAILIFVVFLLSWASKKWPAVANINPIPTK